MPRNPHKDKLSEDTKRRIYHLYKDEDVTQPALAERFGVSQAHISFIIKQQEALNA